MASLRSVREIVVRYSSEGAEKVRREHDEFAKSGERVEKSAQGVAVATETVTRRQASAQGAYERVRAQMDRNYRAQQQLDQAQRTYDRALQQGIIDQRTHAEVMEIARQRKAAAVATNDNFTRSIGQTNGAVGNLYGSLRNLVGVYASFATLRSLGGMGDEWSELQSRVSNATGSIEAGRATLERLVEMSARTYSSIQQTTNGWLDQKLALDELGYSTSAQLDLIETLNNSLVISATRGDRAQSVMKAWSDAMATGKLQTEGLNSILTGSPRLAQALADSLDVSVSSLRSMASEGELTTQKLFGVTSQLERVRKEADAMDATIADGWVRIQNSLLQFVGAADQAGGSTSALALELVKVSDWMDANGQVAVAIGDDIALTIENIRTLGADISSAYATAQDALTSMQGGIDTLLGSLRQSSGEASSFGSAWFDMMAEFRARVAETMLDAVERISAIPSAGKAAYDVFMDGWRQFPAALGGLIVEGAARTIEIVEGMVDGVIGLLNRIPTVEIDLIGGSGSSAFRDRFGTDGGEAAKGFVDGFLSEFQANQSRVRDGFAGLAQSAGDALGYETREARHVREAYDGVTEAAGAAWEASRTWLFGTRNAAPEVGRAVNAGVTEPTKEAEKAAKAFADQLRSLDQNTDSLQRQIDTLGQTAGATAAVELRARELARAWDIAREAGMNVLPKSTTDAIDRAAASVESLTNHLERMKLETGQSEAMRMMEAEARLVGMSENARTVAMAGLKAEFDLRRQNILTTDEWGAAYVRNAQHIAANRIEIDRQTAAYAKQQDLLSNVASTLIDAFDTGSVDGFFDSVTKGLADVGGPISNDISALFDEEAA